MTLMQLSGQHLGKYVVYYDKGKIVIITRNKNTPYTTNRPPRLPLDPHLRYLRPIKSDAPSLPAPSVWGSFAVRVKTSPSL